MGAKEQRMAILREVEAGNISVEAASEILAALEGADSAPQPVPVSEFAPPMEEALPPAAGEASTWTEKEEILDASDEHIRARVNRWRQWWLLPFGVGLLLLVLGGVWMYQGLQAAGLSWGFWLSWIPFLLGVVLTALGWEAQKAPWLYIHIRQKPGEKPETLTFFLPLPFRWAAWGTRFFDAQLPEEMRGGKANAMLRDLEENLRADAPMHVLVDDEDGEHVEVLLVGKA